MMVHVRIDAPEGWPAGYAPSRSGGVAAARQEVADEIADAIHTICVTATEDDIEVDVRVDVVKV